MLFFEKKKTLHFFSGPQSLILRSYGQMCFGIQNFSEFRKVILLFRRSQWPRGLRFGSAAARLLGLWVRIPPNVWMAFSPQLLSVVKVEVSAWG